jgi:2',3'-cyclic-nucleotide 2'-phosphodiesterase (5'-nucleotidase family)
MIISINYFTIMNTTKKSPDPKILGISSIAVIMAIAALFPSAASVVNEITVIYTGETHAMLHPCDCPEDPGGGLAERAGFLDAVFEDRGSVLLLDGGGFSGGGIYDTYSAGRAADSVRTARTIAAMGMMRYDAVAVGDDDLQYGAEWLTSQAKEAELPLVCANCFTENGGYLVAP